MKQELLFLTICVLLLASPVNNDFLIADGSAASEYVPAATDFQRVYGIDYSHEIFDSVSLNSFRNFIIKLTENGSRPAGLPAHLGENNIAARNWIANELRAVSKGRIEVEVLGNYGSVLGKLPGYLPVDAPALMVGGHYDSVFESPGANDDGT
ncbi:MAG: M28 family peptidase, partial [Candidatus Thorarchaeota archaeon]